MNNPFIFQITSLFRNEGNGVLSSPLYVVFVVHEVEKQTGILINRLAKVTFDDPRIHQFRNHQLPTRYQTYLIGTQHSDELWLALYVDVEDQAVPVAVAFQSNRLIGIKSDYADRGFLRHLTLTEITAIFNHAFDHPETIAILPKK